MSSSNKKSRKAKAAKSLKRYKEWKKRREQKKQQKLELLKQQGFERLKEKIDAGGHYDSSKIRINPEEEVKMSEVLGEFIKPYRDTAHNQQQYENLLRLAVIAWNLSFLPQDEQLANIQQVYKTTEDPEAARFYSNFLVTMIQRKDEYFAEHDRMIVDFTVMDAGKEYRVTVASTMPVNGDNKNS